jgi:hypothetical protein
MISDADKKLVHVTNVAPGAQFGGPTGILRTRIVSFTVDGKGPYNVVVSVADYTADNVWEQIGKEIATLRGIGAL